MSQKMVFVYEGIIPDVAQKRAAKPDFLLEECPPGNHYIAGELS
jgi:hypothetical protein